MDAMTLLHERSSMGKLTGPAPSREQLDAMYRAALRAPDHKELRPWRFIEFSGEGLDRLGELFAEAEFREDPKATDECLNSARMKPKRAPMIIGVVAKVDEYVIKAITGGSQAMGEVTLRVVEGDLKITGRGASTDIIEASGKAFVDALNRLEVRRVRQVQQAQTL